MVAKGAEVPTLAAASPRLLGFRVSPVTELEMPLWTAALRRMPSVVQVEPAPLSGSEAQYAVRARSAAQFFSQVRSLGAAVGGQLTFTLDGSAYLRSPHRLPDL